MIVYVILILIAVAAAGCWHLRRKGPLRMTILTVKKQESAEPPAPELPKCMPEFVEELRRREQAMKAGMGPARKPQFDLQEVRRKEREINSDQPNE